MAVDRTPCRDWLGLVNGIAVSCWTSELKNRFCTCFADPEYMRHAAQAHFVVVMASVHFPYLPDFCHSTLFPP